MLGGAAAAGASFDKAISVGTAINANTVTIGSSLDHCHVPGRQNHETLPEDVLILGMGIHNEPGLRKLSPLPTIQELLSEMVKYLVDPNDEERAYVKFDQGDEIVLLVNNFGGLSALETGAITYQTLDVLKKEWDIAPIRVFSDSFESSLNGPGFSATLLNLTKAAAQLDIPTSELIGYLDAPTTAPSFPKPYRRATGETSATEEVERQVDVVDVNRPDFSADPKLIETMLRTACNRAIASEPSLTKWDMIMGDGDCGDGVKAVSTAILKLLDEGTASESIMDALDLVGKAVDDMGGTLGAIFGILVAALATAVSRRASASKPEITVDVWGDCAYEALESLKTHTAAREGDRTVMDVLIPFCDALYKSKDLTTAVSAAKKAAEGTWDMKPKFGRATYVSGGDDDGRIPPDPGAWAVYEMVVGLLEGSA